MPQRTASRDRVTCDSQARSASPAQAPPAAAALSRPRWYALRLRSRHEFAVQAALTLAGVEAFLPTFSETTRWTDRTSVVTRALFPGYVFARFPLTDAPQVLQTRGVVQILGAGLTAAPIEDAEMENLRRVASIAAPLSPCAYVAGDAVTVGKGPFAGVAGVVTRTKGATRLVVAVEILRRAVSVEIDAADLEERKP